MIVYSREELIALSGYRQRSRITRWLKDNGFRVMIGGDGWPRVLRDEVVVTPKTLTRSAPNVAALRQMQGGRHG